MSPHMPELHDYRHRQPLDRAHVVVIAETLSDDQVNYEEQANFQAASADCRVPVTGQGKVTTVDPDLTFFVDRNTYQRITVLNSSLQLLHRLTYVSPITVQQDRGPVVLGLQFIKHDSKVIPITARATKTPGRYLIEHGEDVLHQERLGEVSADDLPAILSAALTLWSRNYAKEIPR
jgi:hypothetical protein